MSTYTEITSTQKYTNEKRVLQHDTMGWNVAQTALFTTGRTMPDKVGFLVVKLKKTLKEILKKYYEIFVRL